jgi:UDP-N-acetylmuramoyl-tripeptide--D-alanyl-D-alanine ligase
VISLSLAEVARTVGGQLVDGARGDVRIDGPVVIDSRRASAGGLFVCIVGERVDGHDFARDAVDAGALAVVAARPVGVPAIVVDDPAIALGGLATAVLRRVPSCRIVGVTGSVGKTSTKDLLHAVFSTLGETVAPIGSYNTEYGLPLTALDITMDTKTLVLEYGARGAGHIRYLTSIARPSVAVVLNVGTAHIGEFGSREAIAQAKGELVEALPPDGVAVLNADDQLVAQMSSRSACRVMTFGTSRVADVQVRLLDVDDLVRPRLQLTTPEGSADITLRLHGEHQVHNAAAACAAGLAAGIALGDITAALSEAEPRSAHRMRLAERADGLVVIDDAYNASPESVRSALDSLSQIAAHGRRSWAVLGPMRELGAESAALHQEIGELVAASGVERLVVVGPDAVPIMTAATQAPAWQGVAISVADAGEATALLLDEAGRGDVVLVKAANAEQLWRVAESLLTAEAAGSRS